MGFDHLHVHQTYHIHHLYYSHIHIKIFIIITLIYITDFIINDIISEYKTTNFN